MIGNLTNEEIEDVLKRNSIGRIGCNDGRKTYVVPVNYVYDGKCIIVHSYDGMKIQMMRKNSGVCFEVDEIKSFTAWKSVIAWGEYQELTNERKRYEAMKLFLDRMIHPKIRRSTTLPHAVEKLTNPPLPPVNPRSIIYRIVITDKTGRFEDE